MALEPNFDVFKEAFTQTAFLGTEWLLPLAITAVVMALITRDIEKWKILAFPVLILERIMGLPVHFVLLTFAAILFIIEALSIQVVGKILSPVRKDKGESSEEDGELGRYQMLKDFKKAQTFEKEVGKMSMGDVRRAFGRKGGIFKSEKRRRPITQLRKDPMYKDEEESLIRQRRSIFGSDGKGRRLLIGGNERAKLILEELRKKKEAEEARKKRYEFDSGWGG